MSEDLELFTLDELEELLESAKTTLKLLKKQIAGVPTVSIPTIILIQIEELERRIEAYEQAIEEMKRNATLVKERPFLPDELVVELKDLLSGGKTKQVIEKMIREAAIMGSINQKIILLSNRFNILQDQFNHNIISDSDYRQEFAKLNYALLDIINQFTSN